MAMKAVEGAQPPSPTVTPPEERATEHRDAHLPQDVAEGEEYPRMSGEGIGREERQRASVEAYRTEREGLGDQDECDALDWLLGGPSQTPAPTQVLYDVKVTFDTPQGPKPLTFVIHAVDGREIEAINDRHANEKTGRIDIIASDCEQVVKGTARIEGMAGHAIDLKSEEFRRVKQWNKRGEETTITLASPILAVEHRFRNQLGLISGVAAEIRKLSGYGADAVGSPQRHQAELVQASGN